MKKSLPVFLLALIGFNTITAQRLTIEELTLRLSRRNAPDTAHVNLLNELSRRSEIMPGVRDSLVNESLKISRAISYTAGEAYALTVKAQYLSDVSQSADISRQAIALAQKSGDKKTLFWAYRSLGQSMLNTSENIDAINPFRKALEVAEAGNDPELIISGQLAFVDYYRGVVSNYPLALEWSLKALKTAEDFHDTKDLPGVYRNIGAVYLLTGDHEKSLSNLQKALDASKQTGDYETAEYTVNDMGEQYRLAGKYPEALKAYGEAALLIKDSFNIELNQSNVADVYQRMGNNALCFQYAFLSLAGAQQLKDTIGLAWIDNILSRAYLHTGKPDSAIYYGRLGYDYAVKTQVGEYKRDNSEALSDAFDAKNNSEEAFHYYKIFITSRDSIMSNEVANKAHLAQYNYDIEKKQAEISVLNKDKELQQAQVQRQRFLLAGTVAMLMLIMASLFIVYRNNRRRKKAYVELHEQKQEIQSQRDRTNHALNELKLTQTQLIQSEKMASLGELTAGIAHEIQNPLNFVNNFSEVNNELIEELKSQKSKLKSEEQDAILNDIFQNNEKINHHGKRADAIVKGMLQHSRSSSGQKEPTDINALADEYLRLAFHGLRAKDKSFNANMKTGFDESIGNINIVSQDIGRVILNLITNAFYAVNEKKKAPHPPKGENKNTFQNYEPTVTVKTSQIPPSRGGGAIITVEDNGAGIPRNIVDKIFQPFFTTKPTGQGTGLGLSLSYDIIKAHGGEIKVETKENEYTIFTIILPGQSTDRIAGS